MDNFTAQDTQTVPRIGPDSSVTNRNEIGHEHGSRKVRIATVNVSTIRDKEEEMIEIMKERKLDILGLCETRLKEEGRRVLQDDYQMIWKGGQDARHGVAFLISPEIGDRVISINYKNERIIEIEIDMKVTKLSLIQVYAPQQGRPTDEKEEFYNCLQEVYEGVVCRENIIVLGDLNGHVGRERIGIQNVIGAFSIGNKNVEGERIIDFCVVNSLSIMNTFYCHQDSHKWTWYRWNSARQEYTDKSMIDLMLTNSKNLFMDVKAIPSVSCDSDHRMVIAKLKIKKPNLRQKRQNVRYKLENLNNPECVEELQHKLRTQMPTGAARDVEDEWKHMSQSINSVAKEVIQVKVSKSTKKKTTAWWTEEVREAVKLKMRAFRRWMKTRRQDARVAYVELRGEAERVKREAKRKVWENIGRDLKDDLLGTRKLIFSMAKNYKKGSSAPACNIRDESGTRLLTEPEDIANRWGEYFENLLNVENCDGEDDSASEEEEEGMAYEGNENEITSMEVKEAVNKMKNGKAPGDDELPVEIFKALGNDGIAWLKRVFNAAWNQSKTPSDWGKAIVCPIHKKGEKCHCANYRGISLLSHVSKIYERILEKRLRTKVEEKLGEWHHGFRPGRGTTDLIFTLKMILEKSWEWNQKKCIGFIDLEKAFDRVPRRKLWRVLKHEEYGVGLKLFKAIKSIYDVCESKVKCREKDSRWFEVKSGVRQGGVLSPLLFVIYMDCCMKAMGLSETSIDTFAYADDVAIVTDTSAELQGMLNRWYVGLELYGMKMSKTKTEVMIVSRQKEESNINIGGHRIKQTENFTYLGVNINEENLQIQEISTRINKYNKTLILLYPLLRDKHVPTESKMIIYTSMLRPVLIYGSEAWAMTTKTKSMIQAAEMKVLRVIKGVTRMDRLRNTKIQNDLKVTPILEIIERNKLRWFGHVQRMGEEKYPKRALNWTPQGRRPVGRPRMRWMRGIEEALEKRGTTVEEVMEEERYWDRMEWRRMIEHSS